MANKEMRQGSHGLKLPYRKNKTKPKIENNEEIPSFLYNGIPTSLSSSDLSSTLHHNTNSGSPYPVMDGSRKSSATSMRTPEKATKSPNLKVNTSMESDGVGYTHRPSTSGNSLTMLLNSRRSIEKFEASNDYKVTPPPVSLQTSTPSSNTSTARSMHSDPLRKPPLYPYRHPSLGTPSKVKNTEIDPHSLDSSEEDASHLSGSNFFHRRSFDHARSRMPSIPAEATDDFSYERTMDLNFETTKPANDESQEDRFYFAPSMPTFKTDQSIGDPLTKVTSNTPSNKSILTSHTPSNSAGGTTDMFVSPLMNTSHERSHSNNSSLNQPSSFSSRKITRSRVINSPHSRQSSLSWAVNIPDEWTLERVVYWLNLYGFNKSWVDCFTQNNLVGSRFLSLTNYNNISKYIEHLDFSLDSTPSRFIHLLRKTLDKPNSDAARLSSPSFDPKGSVEGGEEDEDSQSILSSSDLASVTPSPSDLDHKPVPNILLADLVPTISAPNYSSSVPKPLPTGRGSQDLFAFSVQRPRTRDHAIARPFSTIEHSSHSSVATQQHQHQLQHHFQQPGSPASFSLGMFKKHNKSNSSDSSLFSNLFTGSGPSAYCSEYDTVSKKSSKLESPTLESSKKSLITKLRNKVSDRAKAHELKTRSFGPKPSYSTLSSHSSPIDGSFLRMIPETKQPPSKEDLTSSASDDQMGVVKFTIDKKYQPKSRKAESDLYILVTKDNKSFLPCNVGQSTTALKDLKSEIAKTFDVTPGDILSYHLTDFGCDEGELLDDNLLEKLQSVSFYNGTSKLYVRVAESAPPSVALNDLSLSATSTRSSISHSLETNEGPNYPATPQYLLGVTKVTSKEPVDYLNFKDTLVQAKRKSSLVGGKGLQPLTSIAPDSRDESTPNDSPGRPQRENNYLNSFRVIRKESSGEIDFDKRRESPFQRSMIIAKRNPPPPPSSSSEVSRSSSSLSVKRSIKGRPRLATSQLEAAPRLTPGSTIITSDMSLQAPNANDKDYLSPFTPGLSTTLVPQPYRGSVSPGSRTPVSPRDETNTNRPAKVVTTSINSHPSIRRDDSLKSFKTISEKERFNENIISFEGVPSLSDDESSGDSDDDLWAKVPGKKTSSETINVDLSLSEHNEDSAKTPLFEHENSSQMTVRPPAEVVYDNLERFFPNTDLDKPIVDADSSPLMSPLPETSPVQAKLPVVKSNLDKEAPQPQKNNVISRKVSNAADSDIHLKVAKERSLPGRHQRMKTIRVVAREANEARKRLSENANNKKPNLLRRTSTKMWGQKVVEVTPSQLQRGFISKFKNHQGEYKEFAWVKGELIGKGTFGKVFLALNVTTGEMMAVKQVKVPRSRAANHQLNEVIDALLSEVETMKDLDHINIVQYLGFESLGNMYSLFLEYVAGGSVGSCLRMYGRFEESLIRFLTFQVLNGLSYLHSRGILHRDLKADNLLLEIDGSCKISDFGISKRSQNIYANDAEMSMQGTIFWMAPEVIDNVVHNKKQGYSAKIDIWSLGCVVLEMFAGRRPWSNVEAIGAIYKLGKTKLAPPIPEDTLPYVGKEGKDFIEKCFIIDPEKRPTAQELLNHPFCKVPPNFEFKQTKLAHMIKFNEKSKEKVLRLEAKENKIKSVQR